ncbi:DUF2845 domain-containing protein [Marinobacter sp. SS21]|uniref:DUF2845 domain-containing protein n=1 Tax=Marinobacter sp. SS21 TaxID=2979460 RepID=UPI00232B522E|nr:DUF2845 domain-containing protein [Marinobacter sp. SS21]MDC0663649.1 DUF2845 domain-containing protein [Marinobacter sp. SS21]
MVYPCAIHSLRLAVLLLVILLPGTALTAFRCGSALVDIGDWPVEVEERCGAPDYVAIYPAQSVAGLGVTDIVEHWYYNPGPHGLIRRLEFRNGQLRRERSLGYGFHPSATGRCSSRFLREGLSEFEVVGRCGEPLSQRIYWRSYGHSRYRGQGAGITVIPVKEWLFEFGANEFRRVVILHNGLVTEVRSDDKPR